MCQMRRNGGQVQVLALSSGLLLHETVPGEALAAAQEDLQDARAAGGGGGAAGGQKHRSLQRQP